MEALKTAGAVILGIVVITVVGFALNAAGYVNFGFWAPKYEQVRHDTFECSASHADGIVRELRQMREQYTHADAAGKATIADAFKHEADGFTCYSLPADLQDFAESIS